MASLRICVETCASAADGAIVAIATRPAANVKICGERLDEWVMLVVPDARKSPGEAAARTRGRVRSERRPAPSSARDGALGGGAVAGRAGARGRAGGGTVGRASGRAEAGKAPARAGGRAGAGPGIGVGHGRDRQYADDRRSEE